MRLLFPLKQASVLVDHLLKVLNISSYRAYSQGRRRNAGTGGTGVAVGPLAVFWAGTMACPYDRRVPPVNDYVVPARE